MSSSSSTCVACSCLISTHPSNNTIARSWQVLDAVTERGSADVRVVEHVCRALRLGIKASGKACGPLMPTLLTSVLGRFKQTRHSAYL